MVRKILTSPGKSGRIGPTYETLPPMSIPRYRGRIVSREKCPVCGRIGKYQLETVNNITGLLCGGCHSYWAEKPDIRIQRKGDNIYIHHDKNGNRFHYYEDARNAQIEINRDIDNNRFNPDEWRGYKHNGLIWGNYVRKWIEDENNNLNIKPSSARTKTYLVNKHIIPLFAGRNIREIKQRDIDGILRKPELANLTPISRKNVLAQVKKLLHYAYKWEDIDKPLEIPKISVEQKQIKIYSKQQQDLLLSKIESKHQPIFEFLFRYGTRVGEALVLMWDCVQIDIDEPEFTIKRTWTSCGLSETTKTRQEKTLPIYDEWLPEHLKQNKTRIGRAFVFNNPDTNQGYTKAILQRIYDNAVRDSGLEHIPLKNATRHSLASRLREEGYGVDVIAAILTHTSLRYVNVYAKMTPKILRKKLAPFGKERKVSKIDTKSR